VLRALQLLGVPVEAAIMVGDAPSDIASAHGAGVTAVAATWATASRADLMSAGADIVVSRPAQLLAWCPPVPAQGHQAEK
jgi:AHBA synthesis associated protein